jgi:hypothetical protein
MGKVVLKPGMKIMTADGPLYATAVDGVTVHSEKPISGDSREAISAIIEAAKRTVKKNNPQ